MGAKKASYNLPCDYNKNVSCIFKYSQNSHLTSTMSQNPTTAFTSEYGGPKHKRTVHKESGNTNGSVNGENGHTNGKTNGQVNEIVNEMKPTAIEKPLST